MKTNPYILTTSIILAIFCYTPNASAKEKRSKPTNISIHINRLSKDSIPKTYFNLGLISRLHQLEGIGVNILSSIVSTYSYGIQLSGLANIVADSSAGLQIAGITNVSGTNTYGITASGFVNITGRASNGITLTGGINIVGNSSNVLTVGGLMNMTNNMTGLQIAGISNLTGRDSKGLAISGLFNLTGDNLHGTQLTALLNIAGENTKGAQISGVANVGLDIKGAQISGVSNIAIHVEGGLQLAPTNIAMESMKGAQLGLGNYATNVNGIQIGLLNTCAGEVKGVQIGLINHSKDTSTVKIGLVNVNPQTRIQLLAYAGNAAKTNLAVRFQNKIHYNILGIGTHYLGLNDKFSGALFYRTGIFYPIFNRLMISGDLGYFHIENFKNESAQVPERMYSLQARVSLEYQPFRKLSVFASGGYGTTRYYHKDGKYENKPVFEFGIVLF